MRAQVFFHCDQLIRGLYEPFVRDWHEALGAAGLLVLRVEDLLDDAAPARARLLDFLGLGGAAAGGLPPPEGSYFSLHAASLRAASAGKAEPMRRETRERAEAFYEPHNKRLAALLGEPALAYPHGSTHVEAEALQ